MEPSLRVGQLARLHPSPPKTIRYYEQVGVLRQHPGAPQDTVNIRDAIFTGCCSFGAVDP